MMMMMVMMIHNVIPSFTRKFYQSIANNLYVTVLSLPNSSIKSNLNFKCFDGIQLNVYKTENPQTQKKKKNKIAKI